MSELLEQGRKGSLSLVFDEVWQNYGLSVSNIEFNEDIYNGIKQVCESEGLSVSELKHVWEDEYKFDVYKPTDRGRDVYMTVNTLPFSFTIPKKKEEAVFDKEHKNGLIDKVQKKLNLA